MANDAILARTAFTRGVLGLAILTASGFVSIDTLTEARPRSIPASAFSERFGFDVPAATSETVDLSAARRDLAAALARLPAAWSDHRGPTRNVTVERRIDEATSELVRYRVSDIAAR